MKRLALAILIVWCMVLTTNQWQFASMIRNEFREVREYVNEINSGNVIRYNGEEFLIYGLEGAGKVAARYGVYSPVYIRDIDFQKLSDLFRTDIYNASLMKEAQNDKSRGRAKVSRPDPRHSKDTSKLD